LNNIKNICIYEYNIVEGEKYPKSIYIKFNYSDPYMLIKELKLLPFPLSSNKDTVRSNDYDYARLIHNFWRMSSTKVTQGVTSTENSISSWWRPENDSLLPIYGSFYNEFYPTKIVSSKEHWTGRLVMQPVKDTVFIQIDLFQGR
jgi:hypothetical protein